MNEQQDQISLRLGEISGELRAIIRQNATLTATMQSTQATVQTIAADLATVRATQQSMAERMDSLGNRVGHLEEHVHAQDITVAKQSATIGAAASIGMALIIEGIKQWINK